jgi:hypothetical protein
MDTQLDLQHALIDVRKAYRLIWLYQRRVVDIIRLITDTLGYRFYHWDTEDSIGRMPGQTTTDPFSEGRWIWATLPLYRMSLLYLPTTLEWNVQKKGEWMLEIFVETDTGAAEREDESEPTPSEFKAADQSETFLRLYAWYCTGDENSDWFSNIWYKLDWPEQDDEVTVEHPAVPVRIVRKSLELSKLADRASVERAIAEFKTMVSNKFQQQVTVPPPQSEPTPTSIRLRG